MRQKHNKFIGAHLTKRTTAMMMAGMMGVSMAPLHVLANPYESSSNDYFNVEIDEPSFDVDLDLGTFAPDLDGFTPDLGGFTPDQGGAWIGGEYDPTYTGDTDYVYIHAEDEDGNPLFDEDGNPIVERAKDENGNYYRVPVNPMIRPVAEPEVVSTIQIAPLIGPSVPWTTLADNEVVRTFTRLGNNGSENAPHWTHASAQVTLTVTDSNIEVSNRQATHEGLALNHRANPDHFQVGDVIRVAGIRADGENDIWLRYSGAPHMMVQANYEAANDRHFFIEHTLTEANIANADGGHITIGSNNGTGTFTITYLHVFRPFPSDPGVVAPVPEIVIPQEGYEVIYRLDANSDLEIASPFSPVGPADMISYISATLDSVALFHLARTDDFHSIQVDQATLQVGDRILFNGRVTAAGTVGINDNGGNGSHLSGAMSVGLNSAFEMDFLVTEDNLHRENDGAWGGVTPATQFRVLSRNEADIYIGSIVVIRPVETPFTLDLPTGVTATVDGVSVTEAYAGAEVTLTYANPGNNFESWVLPPSITVSVSDLTALTITFIMPSADVEIDILHEGFRAVTVWNGTATPAIAEPGTHIVLTADNQPELAEAPFGYNFVEWRFFADNLGLIPLEVDFVTGYDETTPVTRFILPDAQVWAYAHFEAIEGATFTLFDLSPHFGTGGWPMGISNNGAPLTMRADGLHVNRSGGNDSWRAMMFSPNMVQLRAGDVITLRGIADTTPVGAEVTFGMNASPWGWGQGGAIASNGTFAFDVTLTQQMLNDVGGNMFHFNSNEAGAGVSFTITHFTITGERPVGWTPPVLPPTGPGSGTGGWSVDSFGTVFRATTLFAEHGAGAFLELPFMANGATSTINSNNELAITGRPEASGWQHEGIAFSTADLRVGDILTVTGRAYPEAGRATEMRLVREPNNPWQMAAGQTVSVNNPNFTLTTTIQAGHLHPIADHFRINTNGDNAGNNGITPGMDFTITEVTVYRPVQPSDDPEVGSRDFRDIMDDLRAQPGSENVTPEQIRQIEVIWDMLDGELFGSEANNRFPGGTSDHLRIPSAFAYLHAPRNVAMTAEHEERVQDIVRSWLTWQLGIDPAVGVSLELDNLRWFGTSLPGSTFQRVTFDIYVNVNPTVRIGSGVVYVEVLPNGIPQGHGSTNLGVTGWTRPALTNPAMVTFNPAGGQFSGIARNTMTLQSGMSASQFFNTGLAAQIQNPTREGHIFRGWYIGDTRMTLNTPVTSDLTAVARWSLRPGFELPEDYEEYIPDVGQQFVFSQVLFASDFADGRPWQLQDAGNPSESVVQVNGAPALRIGGRTLNWHSVDLHRDGGVDMQVGDVVTISGRSVDFPEGSAIVIGAVTSPWNIVPNGWVEITGSNDWSVTFEITAEILNDPQFVRFRIHTNDVAATNDFIITNILVGRP